MFNVTYVILSMFEVYQFLTRNSTYKIKQKIS